jgi:ParB family transcriptional regulator, chromosome partitioning protein
VTTPRRTGGLGRGLGALIPTGPSGGGSPAADEGVSGARFAELPVGRITPNPLQPRQHFDEEAMAELVVSIREIGLLQPVVVREIDGDDEGPRYELVMGERRWRATQSAGLDTIPAIVRDTSDDDMLRDALLENLHRQQLNPLEEAVQRRVAAGVLSAGHARAILGLPTPEAMEAMADRVVAEGLSVRGVEEAVHLANSSGEQAPTPAPRPGRRPVPAGLSELGDRLSDRLETRVKIDLGRKRGKMTIEFATLDDLHRIVGLIEPEAVAGLAGVEQPDDGQHQDGQHGDHHDGGHSEHGHHEDHGHHG